VGEPQEADEPHARRRSGPAHLAGFVIAALLALGAIRRMLDPTRHRIPALIALLAAAVVFVAVRRDFRRWRAAGSSPQQG